MVVYIAKNSLYRQQMINKLQLYFNGCKSCQIRIKITVGKSIPQALFQSDTVPIARYNHPLP